MTQGFPPPLSTPEALPRALAVRGEGVLGPGGLEALAGVPRAAFDAWKPTWNDLPPDGYLRDGGRYRRRRHASLVVGLDGAVEVAAQRAHWQPLDYNALHGGIERWFEPIDAEVLSSTAWASLMHAFARLASALRGPQPWFVEAHQFRIDTAGGIGRPTPEGAHRDGVDLVAVILVERHAVKGGETRVFEADGPHGLRFTLAEPWSALVLDDARVVHETTPIQPAVEGETGWRDTLVLTLRAGGFQGPEAPSG
jgi:hypothetical protein